MSCLLQINVFSILILIILHLSIIKRTDLRNMQNRFFSFTILFIVIIQFLDILIFITKGHAGYMAKVTIYIVTTLYYILNPLPSMMWSLYCDYFIHKDEERTKKYFLLILFPCIINAFFSIMGVWHNSLYYIDASNMYHRGNFFFIVVIACYFYFFITMIQIIKNKNKIRHDDLLPLMFFAFPPFFAGVIQTIYYGVTLIWPATTLSLLIVFVNVQSEMINKDHLTGLYNRRQFDNYILSYARKKKYNKTIAGLMIDIDDFKHINDTYGHQVGDTALIDIGNILMKSFRCNDFIARYGGDEFAVLFEIENKSDIECILKRLNKNLENFNNKQNHLFKLGLSIGAGIYYSETGMSLSDFIKELDFKMYENKRTKNVEARVL